jgi:ribosomal protein S18 acetylase RimI-like enzyme
LSVEPIQLIRHRRGAWRLRHTPGQLQQLQQLLDAHSFWASGRSRRDLSLMLAGSQAAISAWQGSRLVGFGRATSDGVFRAVLWDVVVAGEHQGRGLGRKIVEALLGEPALRGVERTYLMTTNSAGFYEQLGFTAADCQKLMLRFSDEKPNQRDSTTDVEDQTKKIDSQ